MKTTMKGILVFLLVFASTEAGADVYGYAEAIPRILRNYLKQVDRKSNERGQSSCEPMYDRALSNGVLEIHYALGYFDNSTGKVEKWKGQNYGLSPSLDPNIFWPLREQMTGACRGGLNLCEFHEVSANQGRSILEKHITLFGRDILVRIHLTQGSASESFVQNKSSQLQKFFSAQGEENFFGALKTADIVFYNGHSRDGGGPDFHPPILTRANKVDYDGYYRVRRDGMKRMLQSLRESQNRGQILGLFSCFSQSHFYKAILAVNPTQRMILSADDIDYFDSLKASVGYLEAFLRGSCGQELADSAKQNAKLQRGFQGFNLR